MQSAYAANRLYLLPARFGPRPRSSNSLPFRQLDQFPPADIQRTLLELSLGMPHVYGRQSRVAAPQCRALCIEDTSAAAPAEAFIDGPEFCHIHPLPNGSIHLTLPPSVIEGIVALGWAERHPVHQLGLMPNLVMVYAARDSGELEVLRRLIECSSQFAMGHAAAAVVRSVA